MNEEVNIKDEEVNVVSETDINDEDKIKEEDDSKYIILSIIVVMLGLFFIYLYYSSNSSPKIGTVADISFIYLLSKISFSDIIIVIYLILINSKLKKLLKK